MDRGSSYGPIYASCMNAIQQILSAASAFKFFPDFSDKSDSLSLLKGVYHSFAAKVHPDKNKDPKAAEAFQKLAEFYEIATNALQKGEWAPPKPKITVKFGKTSVVLTDKVIKGDVCDCIVTEGGQLLKIPRNLKDNDLVKREAEVIKDCFDREPENSKRFLPELIQSARISTPGGERFCNLFTHYTRYGTERGYSLVEVHEKHKNLDLRNSAWIFRRILSSLITIHSCGWVHCNLKPENYIIYPETHFGMLTSFTGAVKSGEKGVIAPGDRSFYSPDLVNKKPLKEGADLYSAAKIMRYLLGSTPITKRMNGILSACERPDNGMKTEEIYDDFENALFLYFGERKWVELNMN